MKTATILFALLAFCCGQATATDALALTLGNGSFADGTDTPTHWKKEGGDDALMTVMQPVIAGMLK